jgi:hypothetical protein
MSVPCTADLADSSSEGRNTGSSKDPDALDQWILSNLQQHKLRRARVAALTKAAKPFQYEQAEVMLVIGTRMSTSVK